ncbi:hypothetical protein KKF84_12525, partial [Myxococcota bacterium]|nr:hypothetical protein [Myxococcota bacterium]
MRSFLLSLTLIGLIALIPACDDSGGSSTTDVCEGVDCGSHGQCLPVADAPSCTCDDGYHDEDLT